MAGISSKALSFGKPQNQKKYNGIDFTPDLELNLYDAEYRELDAAIARWWQIDPVTVGYEDQSPYESMYNNPIRISDPLGNEGTGCCDGIGDALIKAADYVAINAVGLVNGMLNTLSGGLIPTDPLNFRDKLNSTQQGYYDGAVTVGRVAPLIEAAGGSVFPGRSPVLQTTNGVVIEVPGTAQPTSVTSSSVKSTGNSQGGKYSHLKEPQNVKPGGETTSAQRKRILEENKRQNNGEIRSDISGQKLNLPKKLKKGDKADMNSAEIDHVIAKSKGGSNSNSNLQVASKRENIKKSNN